MKVSVKVGDTVLVNSGKDSGKKGKVLAIKKSKNGVRVLVEGVNIITKAKKARTAQEKSELVKQEAAIDISNVNVVCPSCGKAVRVKHAVVDGKKVRVCACGASLDKKFVKDAKVKKAAKAAETAESTKAEKPAKTEKKSRVTKSAVAEEKATKTAVAKKPVTSRSAQRGV
ncbi:MAG: 50S ribosomal protein L24 [Clostridia bacterium]|nr:50S ribosomal protein L24 [Clostridia bacterium]